MKKLSLALIFILTLLSTHIRAHTTPASSIPHLSYKAILALPSPQKGDLAYDLTHGTMQLYTGAGWRSTANLPDIDCDSFTAISGSGPNTELSYDVATDNIGNVFVIGTFSGTITLGGFTISSAGNVDVFVAKYNPSGELTWVTRAGGSYNDFGTGISLDNAGNIYITGSFYSMMNFNNPSASGSNEIFSAGETEAFVAKYNASGEVQWTKRIGGADNDNAQTIKADNNGNVFVIGNFRGTANFNTPSATGSNELISAGEQDVFMAKYTDYGDLAWIKRAGGTGSDYGYGITADGNGNVYATGGFNGTADFNMPSSPSTNALVSLGNYDIFIAKFDNEGTIQWLKRAGGTNTDIGTTVFADNAGNFYLTGIFQGQANFNNPSSFANNYLESWAGYDVFIVKFNATGEVMWLKRAGGASDDYAADIRQDASGNIYLTGNFSGTMNLNYLYYQSGNELVSAGGQDIFIVKLSAYGDIIWLKKAGGTGADQVTGLAIGAAGMVHATGYFEGTSQFGSSSLVSSGGSDFFLTYIASPPPDPTGTSNASICNNTTTSLSANCTTGTVMWYNSDATTLLFTGSPFVTPTLSSNTFYKVRCENGTCLGNFETVAVKINIPKISATLTPQSFAAVTAFEGIDVGSSSVPKLIDLDSDGLLDLIIGESSNKLIHYEQTAVNSMNFSLVTNNFNNVVGSLLTPTFTDLDGDGLLDLLVGNFNGKLAHYEQASLNSLAFNLVTSTFSNINLGNVFLRQTITDLDGDGLLDLICGKGDGYFVHYEQDSMNSLTFNLVTTTFLNIDFGTHVSPTFTDLDSDGLLDFIVGSNGYFIHYEQATINSLTFNHVTNNLTNVDLISNPNSTFSDIDGDGLLDMVAGKFDGVLRAFEQLPGSFATYLASVGNPSITQIIQVWGGSCLSGDITVTAPTGFEVSLSAGSGFSSSVSLTPTNGLIANTKIYVRFNPLTDGVFTGNLEINSTGANALSLALHGCTPSTPPVTASTVNICFNTYATLTATCASGTVKWYTSSTGYLTGSGSPFVSELTLGSDRIYSVRCEGCNVSSFVDVLVDVSPALAGPSGVSSPTICSNTSTSLEASCAVGTVKWYGSDETTLLFTGTPFITPTLSSNTTYKALCAVGSCVSIFTNVAVKIITIPTGTANTSICNNTTASLSATCASENIKWYNSSGTAIQGTGSPFVTPSLTSTITYKVRCESSDVPGCSSDFVDVTVTVSPVVAPTGTANTTICNNTNTSLSANCTSGAIKWYDEGGTTLHGTGSPFITPNLTSTTTYKVRCEDNGDPACISPFVDVTVTVNPEVAALTGMANTTICNNATASLSASCSSSSVRWYDANGTALQNSGSPFVTPNLTLTTSYKARCESGGEPDCASPFVDVTVTVNPAVGAPTGIANTTICKNTTASLSANCSNGSVKWYDATGTALLNTGSPFVTPGLNATTIYKVRCENGSCSSNFETVSVKVNTPKISAIKNPQTFVPITAFENMSVGAVGTVPKVIDLDGDGLLDMIVGLGFGTLMHYEQEAPNSMNFNQVTLNFNDIDIGFHASPAFIDIDGDGLLDLIIGTSTGMLFHYEQAALNSLTFNLITNNFNSISQNNGGFRPNFTDIDGDGLLDLMIGTRNGTIFHYEQVSTNSYAFSLVTNSFLGINFGSDANPTFTDFEKDGILDLIIGPTFLPFRYYKQAAVNSPSFNLVTNSFLTVSGGVDLNSSFEDIDGDGLLEMIFGQYIARVKALEQVPGSFTNFLGAVGSPSAMQTVQVWGGDCLTDNIIVTAPAGFEVSLSAASGFATSVSVIPTNGSVANTPVYVRFNPLTEGSFTGNLQINSTNTNAFSFALSGCTPPPLPNTSNASICYNTSTSLTATCASGTVKWYDASETTLLYTGVTFVTPDLVSGTTYKVRCEACNVSSFVSVLVSVNPHLNAPSNGTSKTICSNTSTSLEVTCAVGTVKWYDANGTTLLYTGVPFETPVLNANTTYKTLCESNSCSSALTDVVVTIAPVVTAPTGTANTSICHNTSSSLSAVCASGTVKWYNSSGTVLLGTGSPFLTPHLSSNTTYKVRCETGGDPDCASAFVDIIVTVSSGISNPIAVSVNSTAICSGTNITLSASCAAGTVTWYNQATGGTAIGTASPLVQSPATTTTYYASCTIGACESSRVATNQVVVTTQPNTPTAVSVNSTAICSGGNISLSATCAIGTVTWYKQATGGTAIGTGTNLAQSPTTNTTYYVSCKNGTCQSNRVATSLVNVVGTSTTLNLTSDILSGNSAQIATQTITATNKVHSPANVIYKAGNAITLNPGFEAKNGSTFKAHIGGCSD